MKQERNSNIELLRIAAMMLIVAFHLTTQCFNESSQPTHVFFTNIIFGSWGILGVDVFIIISCWFLVDQKFKIKRVINIIFQMLTYTLVYSLISFIYHLYLSKDLLSTTLSYMENCIEDFFSNYCFQYWFVLAYVVMILVSPLLNKAIRNLNNSTIKKILLFFSFIPIMAQDNYTSVCDVCYFIYIYMLVGFLKKNKNRLYEISSWRIVIVISGMFVLSRILAYSNIFIKPFQDFLRLLLTHTLGANGRYSIVLLLDAFVLFFTVIKYKYWNSTPINNIASLMLGVYLFHENGNAHLNNIMEVIILWLKGKGIINYSFSFPLQHIIVVMLVLVVGCVVERYRVIVLQKPFLRYVDKYNNKLQNIDNWFNSL